MTQKHAVIALGSYEHALVVVGAYVDGDGGVASGTLAAYTPHSAAVTCVAARSNKLASGSADETVVVYDLSRMAEDGRLEHHSGSITSLAFDRDASHLVSAGEDAQLCLWRTSDWELTRAIPKTHVGLRGIGALALHPSGKAALTLGASDGGLLRLWDLVRAKPTVASKESAATTAVAWDCGGRTYYLARGKQLVVRDTAEKADVAAQVVLECPADIAAIEPMQAGMVAVGCANGTVVVWDAMKGERVAELIGQHTARVRALSFLAAAEADVALRMPRGMLASASTDGRLVLWDAAAWQQPAKVIETGCRITCAACTTVAGPRPQFAPQHAKEDEHEEEEEEGEEEEPSTKRIKQEDVEEEEEEDK